MDISDNLRIVTNVTDVSDSFPILPLHLVERDNCIQLMKSLLDQSANVLVVSGPEGSGKTTLMADFAARNSDRTISIFITGSSRVFYEPGYVRFSIMEQIDYLLDGLGALDKSRSEAQYSALMHRLCSTARKTKRSYYFVIDGLDDIPANDDETIRLILGGALPVGRDNIKIILSGDPSRLVPLLHPTVKHVSLPLAPFSLAETREFFRDKNLDHNLQADIHRVTGGFPANLAAARRMIDAGTNIPAVIASFHQESQSYVRLEWDRMLPLGDLDSRILALLVHAGRGLTCVEVSEILGADLNEIDIAMGKFSVLNKHGEAWSYVSEPHRRFAEERLRDFRDEVLDKLIEYHRNVVDPMLSLRWLPDYYRRAGRIEQLISILSPEAFATVLKSAKSVHDITSIAQTGVDAAAELGVFDAVFRFGLQRSVLQGMEDVDIWTSRIRALIVLDRSSEAVALANSPILPVDRLELLCVVLAEADHDKLDSPSEMRESIADLFNQINWSQNPDRAVTIATALLAADPNLAFELVAKAEDDPRGAAHVGRVFEHLKGVLGDFSRRKPEHERRNASSDGLSRSDYLSEFVSAAANTVVHSSAAEMIERAKDLKWKSAMPLMLLWLRSNAHRDGACLVADELLNLMIGTTEYRPRTPDLEILATSLEKFRAPSAEAFNRLDALASRAKLLSPVGDAARLQLAMGRVEAKSSPTRARERLLNVYLEALDDPDLASRALVFVEIEANLTSLDADSELERTDQLHTHIERDLDAAITELLRETAQQEQVFGAILEALARSNAPRALQICENVNTRGRREICRKILAVAIASQLQSVEQVEVLLALPKLGASKFDAEILAVNILERIHVEDASDETLIQATIKLLGHLTRGLETATLRARGLRAALRTLLHLKNVPDVQEVAALAIQLVEAWRGMSDRLDKIEGGYEVVRLLASIDRPRAESMLEEVEELAAAFNVPSVRVNGSTYLALLLSIRAYCGLIQHGMASAREKESLMRAIAKVPERHLQIALLSDLAVRSHRAGDSKICREIVVEKMRPVLEVAKGNGDAEYEMYVASAVLPLYLNNADEATTTIKKFDAPRRDRAISEIAEYILNGLPAGEPSDMRADVHDGFCWDDASAIIKLLGVQVSDSVLYYALSRVLRFAGLKGTKKRWTREQIDDILVKAEALSRDKLPDEQNIKHEGYVVALDAQILAARGGGDAAWRAMIQRVDGIPCCSDRAYVLSLIAEVMPRGDSKLVKIAIERASEEIEKIPAAVDRIGRWADLAWAIADRDPARAKGILRDALVKSVRVEETTGTKELRKRIIDLANRLDPKCVDQLADLFDEDYARGHARRQVEEQARIHAAKRSILEPSAKDKKTPVRYWEAAAELSLAALNSPRGAPVSTASTIGALRRVSSETLYDTYMLWSWIIENAIRRAVTCPDSRAALRPLFAATLVAVELVEQTGARTLAAVRGVVDSARGAPFAAQFVSIPAGDRQLAMEVLRDWLRSCGTKDLIMVDPYFGLDELEALKIVATELPESRVTVLTGLAAAKQGCTSGDLDEIYATHYRLHISDHDPPAVEFVCVGTGESDGAPFHDRFWLGDVTGLRLGTSYNGLGKRDADIGFMNEMEAQRKRKEVSRYCQKLIRYVEGKKLRYVTFTI